MSTVSLVMLVAIAAAQEPGAGDVHGKSETGDRYRLGEMNGYRLQQARDRLIAYEQGDHRQDDGAGETSQIAKLSGAKAETSVIGMLACVAIRQRRKQQCTCMRAHVQTVGHQRDRSEQEPADDLGHHHHAAQYDDCPSAAFTALVVGSQKDMAMPVC